MTGKDRQRRLARQHHQRQVVRRVEKRRRVRRRGTVLSAVVAAVVVIGGVSYLGVEFVHRRAAANTADCAYTREPAGGGGVSKFVGLPPKTPTSKTPYQATVTTNRGQIVIDLSTTQAPCTTNSFRFLATKNFFNGTKCHRLTTEGIFVLQCGDPSGTGRGGPNYHFRDENLDGATYPRGTVAMANSGPNTNGSQFFIVYAEGGLEPKYTPFGKVVKGLDIVERIAKAGATKEQAPREEVVVENVAIKKTGA